MQKVMPKRKFNTNGKRGKHSKDTSTADAEENVEDEENAEAEENIGDEEPTPAESGEGDKLTSDEMYTTVDAHA